MNMLTEEQVLQILAQVKILPITEMIDAVFTIGYEQAVKDIAEIENKGVLIG